MTNLIIECRQPLADKLLINKQWFDWLKHWQQNNYKLFLQLADSKQMQQIKLLNDGSFEQIEQPINQSEKDIFCYFTQANPNIALNIPAPFNCNILQPARLCSIQRNTSETKIDLSLNLDGSGNYSIDTDIGFLNHMLELFAKHSGIDLTIKARGDIEFDDHHLIEDIAIVLGEAIYKAQANGGNTMRYGYSLLPMDEVLVNSEVKLKVATDVGGRYAFESNYQPTREKVNDFATEMLRHFFKTLAVNAKMNLHIQIETYGENEHHRIEGIFKCFAHSLRKSLQLNANNTVLSTKGKL